MCEMNRQRRLADAGDTVYSRDHHCPVVLSGGDGLQRFQFQFAAGEPLLAAAVFAHESAAFGVDVLAGVGDDLRPGCRAGVGSGCAEEAGERGDGFE